VVRDHVAKAFSAALTAALDLVEEASGRLRTVSPVRGLRDLLFRLGPGFEAVADQHLGVHGVSPVGYLPCPAVWSPSRVR
jgi:hypothetical protein